VGQPTRSGREELLGNVVGDDALAGDHGRRGLVERVEVVQPRVGVVEVEVQQLCAFYSSTTVPLLQPSVRVVVLSCPNPQAVARQGWTDGFDGAPSDMPRVMASSSGFMMV